ncbi:MAG: hypothetical protein LBE55_02670 [Clostridiales bacterium]|jgi:hypothetical protein|nr:hypothetical protein [Clostridiales bacterium]
MERRHIREVRRREAPAARDGGRGRKSPKTGAYARKLPKRKLRVEAFFGFVFVLVILYIIGYFYTAALRPEISQMRVEMGAISHPTAFRGIIIRDEVVYHAADAGSLLFHVENHERVRAGRVVASIQDIGLVETYRANLADIDQGAVNLQRQRAGMAVNEVEIARRNQAILQYINNAAFSLAVGEVGGIFALGDAARHSLQSRNMLYFSDEIAMMDYAADRERALAGMARAISEVAVMSSGVFSNMVDGLEEQLNVANMSNISRELIADAGHLPRFYSPEVEAGDALFRIIRTNDWFIAAYIDREYAAFWTTNSTVTLYVEDGASVIPLVTQVHSRTDAGDGHAQTYVVFRTNNDLMRFIDRRNIAFRLSREAQEGFKIPHAAIVERSRLPVPADFVFIENNVRAVNLMAGDGFVTESVAGNFSPDGSVFYIMADSGRLRVGDTLIKDEARFRIEAIDTVAGVFVTNIGVTQFREVSTEGFFDENADYIILDPAQNPNLRLFDRIVADARAVSDRLLLH